MEYFFGICFDLMEPTVALRDGAAVGWPRASGRRWPAISTEWRERWELGGSALSVSIAIARSYFYK